LRNFLSIHILSSGYPELPCGIQGIAGSAHHAIPRSAVSHGGFLRALAGSFGLLGFLLGRCRELRSDKRGMHYFIRRTAPQSAGLPIAASYGAGAVWVGPWSRAFD